VRLATFETRRAEEAGLERQAIVKMARSLNPEALDFDQTLTELENAVEVALDVIAKGERGTNLDAFVDAVLGLVAEKTRTGEFDSASARRAISSTGGDAAASRASSMSSLVDRILAREPGGAFELGDERVEGAVLVMRRTEIAQPRMRLAGEPVVQDAHQTRLADARLAA